MRVFRLEVLVEQVLDEERLVTYRTHVLLLVSGHVIVKFRLSAETFLAEEAAVGSRQSQMVHLQRIFIFC